MAKTIVTHVNPDLDAITAAWLLTRFAGREFKKSTLLNNDKMCFDVKLSKVFSVDDMRLAGRTVRQLRRYYTDNQIISARFSHLELIAEGLPVRTSERRAMNK